MADRRCAMAWVRGCAVLALMLRCIPSFALDNPDAPDLVAAFLSRADAYENAISQRAGGTAGLITAVADYETYLDQELNQSYRALLLRLAPSLRNALIQSQKRWIAYRDAEFRFIADNWTQERFGTSSLLSRGSYRAAIVKDRIITLLHYLKNYPPATGESVGPTRAD